MGLSDSIIRQALSDNTGEQLVMQEVNRRNKIEQDKQALLGDPSKLDQMVFELAGQFTPSVMAPKNLSKYASKVEGLESSVPEDHPFRGIGRELRNRISAALKDKKYAGISIPEISQAVTQQYIMEPGENGSPRLEQAYKYKRERDAELKLGLNPFAKDEGIRELPGYQDWLQSVRAGEDEKLASESYFASWDDMRTAALWGAGAGAAIGLVTGGPVGAAVEGGIGAVSAPILEVIAHPVRRVLEGSEWYRSKVSSDSGFERIKAGAFELGVDLGIGVAGYGAGAKAARKGLRIAAEAGKLSEESVSKFLKSGKALDAIRAGEDVFKARKASEKADVILENMARDDVYESAVDAIRGMMAAEGRERASAAVLDIEKKAKEALSGERSSLVRLLDGIRKQKEAGQDVASAVEDAVQVEKKVQQERVRKNLKLKKRSPKQMFGELTQPGAEKAISAASVSGDLDSAIEKVFTEEAVVKSVIKKEANDFVELLTGKAEAGKTIHVTDVARATLQNAGYDVTEIASMERRKLVRLAEEVQLKSFKRKPVKEVEAILEKEGSLPAELLPEAQGIGITIPAEEAVKQSDAEISKMVSEAESSGYLEAMMESGKLKADEVINGGEISSVRTKSIEGVYDAINTTPDQELLIDNFIYDKLEKKFGEKYGEQYDYWRNPESFAGQGDEIIPDVKIQEKIDAEAKKIVQNYGYDIKAMSVQQQKEIFKYGLQEGYEGFSSGGEIKKIRDLFDGKNIIGALGIATIAALTVPLSTIFSPKEAEAAGFDTMTRAVPKVVVGLMKKAGGSTEEARIALMKGIREAKYIPGEVLEGQKKVDLEYFGKQMHVRADALEAGISHGDMLKRRKALPLGFHNLMSPTGVANLAYKTGYSVAVQRAHLQTLWAVHSRDMLKVVDNILADVPGVEKSAAGEIAKMTEPFVKDYAIVEGTRAMESRLAGMEKAIDRLYKKVYEKKVGPKGMADLEKAIAKAELGRDLLRKEVDRLTPQVDAFNAKFSAVEQEIAKKFPSARVFYAAEDTADFSLRPWLRGMVSYEEQIAAGHVKDLMEVYALRMLEGNHKVIADAPYMHHAFHPKYSEEMVKEFLEKQGVNVNSGGQFLKFYKRAKYSKAFVPDVRYALEKYIPDAEKRILTSDFWRKSGPAEYRKSGWYSHMRSPAVQFNKMLSGFWNRMWTADEPEMRSVGNRLANWYGAFETMALIGFSPATAFKHVFKNIGTAGQLGFGNTLTHYPDALGTAVRNYLGSSQVQDGILMSGLRKLGINTRKERRLLDKFADATTHQYKMLHHMGDMSLPTSDPSVAGWIDKILFKMNQKGSSMVAAVESFDRAHSFHAALDMAATKGMTGQQALYGIFDTILKNNFLGGGLNPGWMRKPAVRALFLFQNTPFKILERRLVNGINAWQDVKTAFGIVKKQDLRKTLGELRDLGRYIRKGSDELKGNLIGDALFSSQDVFGTPVTKQFMREFIYVGATIYGLGSLFNADFHPHAFHLPFISSFGGDKPELMVSPITTAVYKGLTRKRSSVDEEGQEVGWVSQFLQDWLGKKQLIPNTFHKLNRMGKDDIPEVYRDSKFRYLFAIPEKEKQ